MLCHLVMVSCLCYWPGGYCFHTSGFYRRDALGDSRQIRLRFRLAHVPLEQSLHRSTRLVNLYPRKRLASHISSSVKLHEPRAKESGLLLMAYSVIFCSVSLLSNMWRELYTTCNEVASGCLCGGMYMWCLLNEGCWVGGQNLLTLFYWAAGIFI